VRQSRAPLVEGRLDIVLKCTNPLNGHNEGRKDGRKGTRFPLEAVLQRCLQLSRALDARPKVPKMKKAVYRTDPRQNPMRHVTRSKVETKMGTRSQRAKREKLPPRMKRTPTSSSSPEPPLPLARLLASLVSPAHVARGTPEMAQVPICEVTTR
jgi:hypothetical protein